MFQALPVIIASQPHLATPFSEENYSRRRSPPQWGRLPTPEARQAGVLAGKLGFHSFSALRVLSLPEEEIWLQAERSFIQAIKNNLYLYGGLFPKEIMPPLRAVLDH